DNKSYKELRIWQRSLDLVEEIYGLVKLFPKEETYALSDQMRRAAISIPSNIAEGNGRYTNKDFLKFLSFSRGSLYELATQIEICSRLGYGLPSSINSINLLIEEIGKMINRMISYRLNREKNKFHQDSLIKLPDTQSPNLPIP
ncbi:MAG: four helix bundle protein, partial [Muribaculaceae bacterium]|nr:four helix bundle protein [Muribaculaceae bacterium]